MRHRNLWVCLGLILALVGGFAYLPQANHKHQLTSTNAETIKQQALKDIRGFEQCIKDFERALNDSILSQTQAQANFYTCRKAYKRFEFLLEMVDPEEIEQLNGADLPHVSDPLSLQVVEPQGLQVIEGLLWDEWSKATAPQVQNSLQKLIIATEQLYQTISQNTLTDRSILEACRTALVRVASLGVSGFDSPIAKHSLPETQTVLEVLKQTLQVYEPFVRTRNPIVVDSLNKQFEITFAFLKRQGNNFNRFDRLRFIKNHINPLYKTMYLEHIAMGIETIEEVLTNNQAVNYKAQNLFDANFLNPYFYDEVASASPHEKQRELGKLLFFDPVLSSNTKRACASCHKPEKAFNDGLKKSLAFDFNGVVDRNSPTLINAIYQKSFFYDLRADSPERQIDHVVLNPKEFNNNYESIIHTLEQSPEYVRRFREAFPSSSKSAIEVGSITKAIAEYVRSLQALNSPFDKYMRNERNTLSQEAKQGFNIFMGKAQCGTCHFMPIFNGTVPPHYTETESEVLGVIHANDGKELQLDTDQGRSLIVKSPIYQHAFKTPTVRNIAFTAPYMHNGVFKTLEEVIDFYNAGGGKGLGLEVENQTLSSDSLHLNKTEIHQLIAFMNSLTDTIGTTSKPKQLPKFAKGSKLNQRKIGGEY